MVVVNEKFETPYGVFSNKFNDIFELEGKKWNNVMQYVLADYLDKQSGVVRKYEDELDFNLIWNNLEREAINKAIYHSINAKARVDPEFEGLLLSAEDRPILYVSDDKFLGADLYTKQGENVYGKWLTTYKQKATENSSDVFYNVYLLERLLKVAINYESLEPYLQMTREGIGIKNLIDVLYAKYGKMIDIPSREIIEETRVVTKKDFTYKPEEIVLNVINNNLRYVRINNLKSFRYKIFSIFVQNVIKKYNFDYSAEKFISKLDLHETDYFIDRVYEGYRTKVLNDEIQAYIPDIYVPSIEEITKYENVSIEGHRNPLPKNDKYAYIDDKTSKLSLKDDRYVIDVENKKFPTMMHYIVYKIGDTMIKNFDSYNMILNIENNKFYRLEDSENYLRDNLSKFKKDFFGNRIINCIRTKVSQHEYLKDYLKSLGRDEYLIINSGNEDIDYFTNSTYNDLRKEISYFDVMNKTGSVLKYINNDSFFVHIQKEMFLSFIDIVDKVTPGNYSHENILCVYKNFYKNIPGIIDVTATQNQNSVVIRNLCKTMKIKLSDNSINYLSKNFIEKILIAEELSKTLFNTNIIYMTKFLIIESKYRMYNNNFIDYNRIYTFSDKELIAMSKLIKYIAICNDFKVVTEIHVDRAYNVLNYSDRIYNPRGKNELRENKFKKKQNEQNEKLLVATETYEEDFEEDGEVYDVADEDLEAREMDYEDKDENNEDDAINFNEDEDVLDLMYGPEDESVNAKVIASNALSNLTVSDEIVKYIKQKTEELSYSKLKNKYRINIYQ